ncbi:MAG TPA: response regulator [Silvibacterium sp.]|jgi:FixJ family two-component response regulator|nr:response regulator [Silvibacterium sp.]
MIDCPPTATRIGLVDDDLSVRKAMGRLLRSHGYECVAYESAEAALADPELLRMQCLVLDIELPEMSGFELRDHLVELGSAIPYIFFTGHAESDFVDWNARMGDSLYLKKPVDDNQLLSLIEKLIARASGLLNS